MDPKKQLLKGQNRRCSPRLKGETLTNTRTTLTNQAQTSIESRPYGVPSQESTQTCLDDEEPNVGIGPPSQTETPFTPPVVSSIKVIEHRTPERNSGVSTPPNTSMSRELRKIEDYWTRQEPVQSDSPRLRCHKRKGLSNDATPTTKQASDQNNEPACNIGVKSNDTEFLPESPIPSLDKKDIDKSRMRNAVNKTNLFILQPFRKVDGDSVDNAYQEQLVSGTKEPDDEEYLPPRKKLRSEVKQDELWEGIPLTVSFKRLTPLLKRTDDQIEKNTRSIEMNESIDNNRGDQGSSEAESNLDGIQTVALPNCPGIEIKRIECDFSQDIKQFEAGFQKQVKKAKGTTPIVKRSARLQQKHNITPIKSTSNLNNDETNHFETTHVPKCNDKINDTIRTPNEDTTAELIDGSENETGPVSLDKVKKGESKALNTSDIANMSISQILTCDSQSSIYDDNVPDVASTVEIELDSTVLYDRDDNTNTNIETVDKTTELSIDDNADTPVKPDNVSGTICPQESNEDKSDKCDGQREDGAISRIGKSYKKQEKKPSKADSQSECSVVKTESEENKQSTVTSNTGLGKGSSVFTLIKETKFGKSKNVPPLKIRLKNTNRSKRRKCWRVNTNTEEESCNDSTSSDSKIQSDIEDMHELSTCEESTNEPKESTPKAGGKKNKVKKAPATPDTLKTKTKKRSGNKKELKKWSPPSNVNLRLNSERRLSMVNGLLSNKVLNNHACVIWSSENRRHMQLSHPDCSTSELDELLREKWTQLAEKEKVRFFQRAWDASKDENKHSTRRQESYEVTEKQTANPSIERFLAMDSKTQHTEIKHWLQFYSEVSQTAYNNVINQFRASLQAEKQEQDQTAKECKSRTKTKKNKSKKQKQKACEADADAKHRRLMFETILKNRQDVLETWAERKEAQAQLLRDNFDSLVRRLVAGDDVDFTPTIKSTRLAEALHDLRDLEKDKRLVVSGEETNGESYATLLNEVDVYLKERKRPSALLDSLGDDCVNQETVEEYLRVTNKLDEHKMPILNAVAIKQVLDDVRHQSQHHAAPLSIYRKHVTLSPPSMLTEWVAEDVIRVNPNVGFRSAVSLLSNKVHPSPAFVTPTLTDHVNVTSSAGQRKMQSLLMTNTNQNCYKTVTYTFTRDRNTNPIISKLKRCSQGYGNGRDKSC